MNEDLTIEEVAVMIETAQSLSRAQKDALLDRIEAETEGNEPNGTVLSDKLLKDLGEVFEKEMKYIEQDLLPNEKETLMEVEDEYEVEMSEIRPDLMELIDEYEHETALLMEQNKKDYIELDKELDEFLQDHKAKSEEAEIASIKAKLNSKPNTLS